MTIQTFLVDLDGVVLHRADYFSTRAKDLFPAANYDAILEFFTGGTYHDITIGKRDLAETLATVLPSWNIDLAVDELLKIWFDGENTIDHAVLDRIQQLRQAGVRCVIATDHSAYRKEDVWNNLQMNQYFDDIIASSDVGATKHDPEFYQRSLERLGVSDPATVAFTDDDPENVAVAAGQGLKGATFVSIDSLNFLEA